MIHDTRRGDENSGSAQSDFDPIALLVAELDAEDVTDLAGQVAAVRWWNRNATDPVPFPEIR